MTNSLWKKVTEKEKEQIKQEAKTLLNQFASKISSIKSKESHFENGRGFREELNPWKTPADFKDLTMLNAPFTEDDFIIAEKGAWKK
jgi:long-subunit acyl-CoA synthetase (AMP-forming)